ncbi:hypothetical protein BIY21_07515 [Vibrio ponticus]|uniref:Uncharacterized protein n=1 Tax=Vibrio ponticus TaxID=265668 RepID=A0ABX3FRJ0_9VIBR|nr:hypothetical protein [Vibrio ponticus]OLQ95058.1 hypothetical protein BIY21_07515 [Vibrio ponticus]
MSAKKSLKKLKKKVVQQAQTRSLKQLKSLSLPEQSNKQVTQASNSAWRSEFKQVSQQALVNVASELAAPFNPVLSWFNDGNVITLPPVGFASTTSVETNKKSADARPNMKSIVHLPMKSPPCKRCPALSNGVCKCAAKKLQKSA